MEETLKFPFASVINHFEECIFDCRQNSRTNYENEKRVRVSIRRERDRNENKNGTRPEISLFLLSFLLEFTIFVLDRG